jgi:hypothetical protein
MTEVSHATPERVTFEEVNLAEILALPSGVLTDFVPHESDPVRAGMQRGALEVPLDALLQSEGAPSDVAHLSKDRLGRWWSGINHKVERLDMVKTYISGLQPGTEWTKAMFLLGTTYIDLQDLVRIVGDANRWEPEEVTDTVRVMSAELITGDKAKAWGWWVDLLTSYEKRKLDFIDGLGKQ